MAKQVLIVNISGLPRLQAALRELSETFGTAAGQRAAEQALMAIARPIVQDARRLAPRRTGKLRRSIRARPLRVRAGRRYVRVGGAVNIRAAARHAHLVEFGTGPRRQRGGRYTGAMPARPFMRPAWERHRNRLMADLAPRVWEHVAKTARRYRARHVARVTIGASI